MLEPYGERTWNQRFNKEEQKLLRKSENYIDLETAKYTDARNVGAEWLCK